MSSILIRNAQVITMDQDERILDQADILIENEIIQEINTDFSVAQAASKNKNKVEKIIDAKGKLVLPGFINAHTHTAMTLLRGYADNQNLDKWLEEIEPIKNKMQSGDVYWGTMLAISEMIRNGITCFADTYLHFEAICQAIIDSGLRGVAAYELADLEPRKTINLDHVLRKIKLWNNKGDGRLTTCFGPHTITHCSGLLLRQIAELSRKNKIPIHIHLAETKKEVNDIKRKYNLSPIELLSKYDFFSQNQVVAAQAIWLGDRDMTIFRNNKVSVVTCPSSNLKLASGICPTHQLINYGINVAIGTDGPASNNSLDVLAEAKLASLLAKYFSSDSAALGASKAFKMATINGARSLGLEKEVGSLEVGKKADLIIMDSSGTNYLPNHNLIANIIYAGQSADTETVIVNGRILMENKKILAFDEEKVKVEFNKRVKRLFDKGKDEK